MRNLFLTLCGLLIGGAAFAQSQTLPPDQWLQQADRFLSKYVIDGQVDYDDLQNQPETVVRLVEKHPATPPGSAERKAVWINLYNLAVIQQVLRHYPLDKPTDVQYFFSEAFIPFAGGTISLDQLEKKQLLPQFPDARLHLVLVCAAVSCPPLRAGAFFPDDLDAALSRQTTTALDDPAFLRVDKDANTVGLSEIFRWYEADFNANYSTITEFINAYRSEALPANAKITYYAYDWSLNEAPQSTTEPARSGSIIQEYTPSRLLPRGSWEVKVFNNLYTQTEEADAGGTRRPVPRATFLTNTVEAFAGVSPNARVNAGLILTFRSSLISDAEMEQPALDALRYGSDDRFARSGLAYVAPSVRVNPFRQLPRFSFQTSVLLPVFERESVNGVFFAEKSTIVSNRVFYDHSFGGGDWQLFSEVAFDFFLGEAGASYANNSLFMPVSLFLSYFPSSRLTFYANTQHARRFDLGNNFTQDYTLVGLGAKYQLTDGLNIELSHARFVAGHANGLGQTFNLGFRYVKL